MDDLPKNSWEKPSVSTVFENETFARRARGEEDPSTQDTLRARNDSHGRSASSIEDIFPGVKLPDDGNAAAAEATTTQSHVQNPSSVSSTTSSAAGPTNHRRTSSALKSDGPPTGLPKPAAHNRHNRQVSWGLENNTKLEIDSTYPPALQQPTLNDPSNLTLSDGTNLSVSSLPYFHPKRGGSGRISVEDLRTTRPMEAEAEQYLIRALEKRDAQDFASNQPDIAESAVLSNIPNEDLDALRPEPDNASVDNQSNCKSIGRNQTGDESEGSREGSGSRRSIFLNRRKSTRVFGGSQPVRHRRTETVGDKLESLAAAMDVVHMNNMDFLLEVDNHSDSMLPPPMQDNTNTGVEEWTGAADAFQQNANLLYSRHRAQTEEQYDEEIAQTAALLSPVTAPSENESVQTAGSRWKLIKNSVFLPKPSSTTGPENIPSEADNEDDAGVEVDSDVPSSSKKLNDTPAGNDGATDQRPGEGPEFKRPKNKFITEFEDFFAPRRKTICYFLRTTTFLIILPCMSVAAVLFYFADNPPTGKVDLTSNTTSATSGPVNENGERISEGTASASWWLLFIGVRQVVTFVLAKAVELFFIDFLAVKTRFSVKVLGSWGTLFVLQAKGWPFLMFVWSILNFALLSGTKPFFHHWVYWQDFIDLFNEKNPSGDVVNSVWHHRVVAIALSLGIVVTVKRFWLGLYLGRQTFAQYSEKLTSVMKKILLVSEVASLGRAFERQVRESDNNRQKRTSATAAPFGLNQEKFEILMNALPDDSTLGGGYAQSETGADEPRRVIDPDDRHPLTGSLTQTQKARITQLLGQWEEPTIVDEATNTSASVNELLQFRRALEYLNTAYPFSGSFGLADRRESTVTSAQEVYERLLLRSPDENCVTFDVIALLGVMKDGQLNQDRLKDLIKLFRPDRDGSIECIDFVKAVDSVYKELRLLRAAVANSSKIDQAFEKIFNLLFYTVVICIILSQIGYDPLALFLSISGVILGFAFMIGSASSKYFEGLLFILVRRPFQIGDGIALSDANTDTSYTGSAFWIVEDVDLFTTKVIYLFTGERATLNNGSLANSRVINSTQSTNAWLFFFLKFPVSVSFEKLQIFQQALEQFFQNRPREWLSLFQFRATRVEANLGFIEYIVIAQHRLPWVQWAELHQSKADLQHFSMELAKKLDIWYKSPPMPVDLTIRNGSLGEILNGAQANQSPDTVPTSGVVPDLTALQDQFRPQFDWQR